MKNSIKGNNKASQQAKRCAKQEESSSSSDEGEMMNQDQQDLIIWPLEKVQQNFTEFIQATSHLDMTDVVKKIDYPTDLEWPSEVDIESVFKGSMSKIQGRQNKKKWKENERSLLAWIIARHCMWKGILCKDLSDEDWRNIAKLIVGRNATQCKYKWLARSKFKLVQVPWSKAEDDALIQIYAEYQRQGKHSKWSEIAKEIALNCKTQIVRQGKQCRERWINKLDPQISKGPWAKDEELTLLQLIIHKGKKWSEISKLMNNSRTENSLKNRYHTIIKKEKNKQGSGLEDISQSDVIQMVMKHYPELQYDNLVHLHEDIDPIELKIVIQVIERLSQFLGIPCTYIRQEEDLIIKKLKVEDDVAKQRFVETMENIKSALDIQIKRIGAKQELDPNCAVQIIRNLLKPQDSDYSQQTSDIYFNQMKSLFKTSQVEFEVEGITNITAQDLLDCQFGIVDFQHSNLYTVPQQYLTQAIKKLEKSEPQLNNQQIPMNEQLKQSQGICKQQQKPQQHQQIVQHIQQQQQNQPQQRQELSEQQQQQANLMNVQQQQVIYPPDFMAGPLIQSQPMEYDPNHYPQQQYQVQLVYPQIVYQPIGASMTLSQGIAQIPSLQQSYWIPQQYYPYYIRPQDQPQYILKTESQSNNQLDPSSQN